MKQIKKRNDVIHYACSQDQYGMDIIKETMQFATPYHKGKKKIRNGEVELLYLIPAASTGIQYGYVGVVDSVTKLNDSSKLNPLWLAGGGNTEWDMLVTFKAVQKISLDNLKNRGIQTKGVQGGIKFVK